MDPRLKAARPAVLAAGKALRNAPAVRDSGAWLEDKEYAVAVHTRRLADPGQWASPIDQAARKIAGQYALEVIPGKLVWELRPPVRRDKATRSAGSSPSPAPATWWSSATISATCPPSPR